MKIRILIGFSMLLALQACVTGPQKYTPITAENHSLVKKVTLYNLVIQDEVKPAITLTNVTGALGGGLLGAVIDSSANKSRSTSAQDIIEPLYNATEKVDYRKLSAPVFNSDLSQAFTLFDKKDSAETLMLTKAGLVDKVKSLQPGDALLYLSSFYQFIDNSKQLMTNTLAFLYIGGKEDGTINGEPKAQYLNSFIYISAAIGGGASDSINLWSKDDGALFQKSLTESIQKTSSMLVYDLQPGLNEACATKTTAAFMGAFGKVKIDGSLIKHDGNSIILREEKTGVLHYLPATAVPADSKTGCVN